MNDQRINDMREMHHPEEELGQTFCYEDGQHWPCDTGYLLGQLETADADAAQAWQRVEALESALRTVLPWTLAANDHLCIDCGKRVEFCTSDTCDLADVRAALAAATQEAAGAGEPNLLIDKLRAERDELIRHKDTNECTRYGHRWRDAFGDAGALCQCGEMVFAVWADEVRPSTDLERANPLSARVVTNPERSARAQDLEDERELEALAASAPPAPRDGEQEADL